MARTAHQPEHANQPSAETLQQRWPNGQRLVVAFRLAKDVHTLEALLAGQPVDPARIHQGELQRALEPRLIQLVRPIDVLHGKAA